ncbi:hypothetical protein SAY86_002556 [Trapa natans]|uniref:C2H2-type domain-containing protein n=1 Tax=Trapa natans TaxID=22666 RepID=A0AAN7R121_TRANT|nr:hypothetical protein SAY86_002556 [Trapa natans]
MELARPFLIPAKRRDLLRLPCPWAGFSWEEKAFADDTAGVLGGGVWPPRSYSCSFCDGEFRSAQALGGHMNVHRRDRARLKHQNPNFSCPLQPPVRSRASSKEANRIDENHGICCRSFLTRKEKPGFTFDHGPNCDTCLSVNTVRGRRDVNLKRHKTKTSRSLHHLVKQCSSSSDDRYSSLLLSSGKMADFIEDDLDLELRLGDPPKVK